MKKIRNLIIIIVTLGLLIGAYFLVSWLTGDSGDEGDTPSIKASEIDSAQIKQFSYSYAGEDISLRIEGAAWLDSNNPSVPLVQSAVATMRGNLGNVLAIRIVETNKNNLGEYGFDDPTMAIDITLSDDSKVRYTIGEINTVVDGYYFITSENSNVYLITDSLLLAFTKTMDDLIMLDEIPTMPAADLSSVSTKEGDEAQLFNRAGSNLMYYYYQYSYFRFMNDETKPIDSVQAEQLFNAISKLKLRSYADYTNDESKLVSYGLDAGNALVIRVEYVEYLNSSDDSTTSSPFKTTQDYILYIGADAGDNTHYARMDESDMICKISKEDVDLIRACMSSDLTSRDVFGVDIDTVLGAEINYNGSEYKIERTANTDSFVLGGRVLDLAAFLDMLTALHADKFAGDEARGEKVFSMDMSRTTNELTHDSYDLVQLDIYECDESYYIVDFDIVEGLMVQAESINEALEYFESIAK